MSENINNIPENENPEYIDFVVEDDVFIPKTKSFSVCKLIAMIFGIISGLFLVYAAVQILVLNVQQINQYKEMGLQFPFVALFSTYLSVVLMFLTGIVSIVGGLLPKAYSKLSAFLLAIPVSHTLVNYLPQSIFNIANKVSFKEGYMTLFMAVAGLLALAAAILHLFINECDCCLCDDVDFDLYEYEDENPIEIPEEKEIEYIEEAIEEDKE